MLDMFGQKTPISFVQTNIYVPENAIAAIKIGVLFWGENQAFNPVHPHLCNSSAPDPTLVSVSTHSTSIFEIQLD